jgi:hypothetical protein
MYTYLVTFIDGGTQRQITMRAPNPSQAMANTVHAYKHALIVRVI